MNHPEDVFRKTVIESARSALNAVGHPCHLAVMADLCHCEETKKFTQIGSLKLYGYNLAVLSIGEKACQNFRIDGYWMEYDSEINGTHHHFKVNIGSIYQISSPSYSGYTVALPDTYMPDELMDPKDLAQLDQVRRDLLGASQDDNYGTDQDRNMQVMQEGKRRGYKGPPSLSVVK